MKSYSKIIIPLFFTLNVWAQHNSDYAQYMFNGLLINPAYAGSHEALSVTALYRKQWLGINGSPVTASFGAHAPIGNKKTNVGLILSNDRFGIYDHKKLNLVYAYRVRFLNGQLSLGLQGGVDSYTTNWLRINTTEKSDPNFALPNDKKITPVAGCGMYYYSQKMYFGFSAPELYNGAVSEYPTLIANTGFLIKAGNDLKIKPSVLFKYIKNSPLYLNLASTFYWKDIIGIGAGYTSNTSAMGLFDLKINDQLRVGYAYEYSLNGLQIYSAGSHEVMLRYLFRYKIESLSTRYF
ncbi:MAG: PorP/SprF family type IX secretion system membrane protein [Bacteroidia bacterium]